MLLVLSALTVVFATAGYLVSAGDRPWLANFAWICGGLVGVVGVAAAAHRCAPPDRPGWGLLLGGCLASFVGSLVWLAYSATSFPASPNPADVCWLAFAAMAAAGLHRLGVGSWRSGRVWLELTPLVVAVCALVTALLWSDIRTSPLSGAGQVTALAYLVFYVCAALVSVQSVLAGALDVRRNRGMAAVLTGLVLEALASILWCPQFLAGTYAAGTSAVDAMWSAGMLLIGVGAWRARSPIAVPEANQVSRRWGGVLPSLTFVTLAIFQVAFVASEALTGAKLALSVGVGMVGVALIARAWVLQRQQALLLAQLRERERELREANSRLSRESRRDPLTGLANRLRLDEDFVDLASEAERYGRSYCLVMCDLDRFKDYNDALGHVAGDHVLRQVASLLDTHSRAGDRVYRYGGEELLLVLRGQDIDAGWAVAERHRANVQAAAMPHPHNPPAGVVTFSAGLAAAQPGDTPADVLNRADKALYDAKLRGRNQIAVADQPRSDVAPAHLSGA